MASETRDIKGRCLCGAVDFSMSLPAKDFPLSFDICNCNSCRHMSGTLALTVVFTSPDSYTPPAELLSKMTAFVFTKRLTQHHCPTCGTHLLARYAHDDGSVSWDVAAGCLTEADPSVYYPHGSIFLSDTGDGGFSHFMPAVDHKPITSWARYYDDGEPLPPYWRPDPSSTEPASTLSDSGRLHAYCKCRGVDFWVARPSSTDSRPSAPALPDLIQNGYTSKLEGDPPQDPSRWWLCADGTKYLAGLCVCDSCRLASGMEVVQWAFVPLAHLSLDPDGKQPFDFSAGSLKAYSSSKGVKRYFCRTCGAFSFFTSEERPELIDVAVGLLDAPEGARAEDWLEWRTSRLSYREDAIGRTQTLTLALEDGLKQYEARRAANQPV